MISLKKAFATRCFVTACGNFALLGYSSGHVDVFNVQSGQYRGTFVDQEINDPTKRILEDSKVKDRAHLALITGLFGDYLNSQTITACNQGFIKIWNFKVQRF